MRMKYTTIALLLAACTKTPEGSGVCTTDTYWTQGDEESPLMHPGGDCIQCHADRGEGPGYVFAGTVYDTLDEEDDCNGVQDVEVVVTDAEGSSWSMTTNAAGNFFLASNRASPVFPITASIDDGAVQHAMVTGQNTGNCASCHTGQGESGAAGRIALEP